MSYYKEEIWKEIPGFNGIYQASNLGRIKSFYFNKTSIRKNQINKRGYVYLNLSNNNIIKNWYVHQLVAMAFLNHKPCGFNLVVDHINDNKSDNRVENLQIVTQRFNLKKTQGSDTSKYKGVSWHKPSSKWRTQIKINNKTKHLGNFTDEYKAHLCYLKALKDYELL